MENVTIDLKIENHKLACVKAVLHTNLGIQSRYKPTIDVTGRPVYSGLKEAKEWFDHRNHTVFELEHLVGAQFAMNLELMGMEVTYSRGSVSFTIRDNRELHSKPSPAIEEDLFRFKQLIFLHGNPPVTGTIPVRNFNEVKIFINEFPYADWELK